MTPEVVPRSWRRGGPIRVALDIHVPAREPVGDGRLTGLAAPRRGSAWRRPLRNVGFRARLLAGPDRAEIERPPTSASRRLAGWRYGARRQHGQRRPSGESSPQRSKRGVSWSTVRGSSGRSATAGSPDVRYSGMSSHCAARNGGRQRAAPVSHRQVSGASRGTARYRSN